MTRNQRLILLSLILIICLFLTLIFWPQIYLEIIQPIGLAVWLLLRIFVLSVDQKYYWGIFILGLVIFLLIKLFHDPTLTVDDKETDVLPPANMEIEHWRSYFATYADSEVEQHFIKRELTHLLTSMYASTRGDVANYLVLEAIKNKEIEIPQNIHDFLFKDENAPKKNLNFIQRRINFWQQTFNSVYRWRNRKQLAAENYRMIVAILNFMESTLEIGEDDGK